LKKIDAVVLAGGKMAADDPLNLAGRDGSRSLIDVCGKPMVQWVIDALSGSDAVSDLYVMGLTPQSRLEAFKPLHYLADQGSMFENIRYGAMQAAKDHPERDKILIASADIPALQPHMVDWLVEQVTHDPDQMLYYNVISQQTMETRFPNANRSFVRFRDISVCGGDLNAIDQSLFTVERPVWQKLANARKHPLKQAGILGFDTLLLVALRLVTLEQAVNKVCRRLSITGRALQCPFADLAMDADKPHQLAILRQHIEVRA